jgi:hypothetical protein
MKTQILSMAVVGIMAGIMSISCGEASKKNVKSAEKNMKEASEDLNRAGKDAKKEVENAIKADWEVFKNASETALGNTEKEIKILREKISHTGQKEQEKLTADLDSLEQKRKELMEKLEQRGLEFKQDVIGFNESAKANEQEFEREFKHDMDELAAALKGFFKNDIEE